MKLRTLAVLSALALGSTALGGCATYDLSTPEGVARYQADLAASQQMMQQSGQFLNQQTQVLQHQAAQTPAPQVGAYGQQSGTAVVYCHDLTGNIITCKQVH